MKAKNLIKVLTVALFAMVIGGGFVAAGHTGEHGEGLMTPDGWAEFKSGSIEGGDYVCWNDHDFQHHLTCVVTVDGVDYTITYKIAGGSGAKIVGVEKVVVPTPVENETEPQNDTPVENETTPIVDPVDEPEDDPSIVDPVVDPIDLQNETTPVVPVVIGNETEPSNGANASADVDEVQTPAKLMKAPIKMQKAGNEWALIAIAILVIICIVGYKRY